jgi:hypothetical protein
MDLAALTKLETEVWDALRRGDSDEDNRLLAEDFLGVYPTGFADRSDHVGQLADGPTVAEFELSEAQMMVLSDHEVMLSYRADWRRHGGDGGGGRQSTYVSSLWSQRDGRWVNVFSQDTPTGVQ